MVNKRINNEIQKYELQSKSKIQEHYNTENLNGRKNRPEN